CFFFQAEECIRDRNVTGVQTCALPISHLTGSTAHYLTFGIIVGTAIAFFFFIESLNYLSAKETTLFGTIEPVMAILASAFWLNVTFRSFQLIGILLIIALILALSLKKQHNIE